MYEKQPQTHLQLWCVLISYNCFLFFLRRQGFVSGLGFFCVCFVPSDSWTDVALIFVVVANLWRGVLLLQHLAVMPLQDPRRWEVLIRGRGSRCATANTCNRAKGL